MFYIQQTHQNGCGFACLKMMLANLRRNKKWLYLSEDEKSMSYKDMIFEGNKYGLSLCAFKANEKREIEKNKSFPMIVSLVAENGSFHAVVVMSIKKQKVTLLDPAVGPRKMNLLDFVKVWDGTGLLIESDDGSKYPYKEIEKDDKGFRISLAILQAVSILACAVGIYFIDGQYPIIISIVCLSLFIILEIISRSYLMFAMKKKDEVFLQNSQVKEGKKKNFFIRLQEYKKQSAFNASDLICEILIISFISFILIINNVWNLILVFVPFLLSLFNTFVYRKKNKKEEQNIAILENQINEEMDEESFKKKTLLISEKAHKVGTGYLCIRYLDIFIMLTMSLINVALYKEFSLTMVLFYFVAEVTIFEQFKRVVSYSDQKKKFHLLKAKLYDTIHQIDENK